MGIIVTTHPESPFLVELVKYPNMAGIRLNTIMPIRSPERTLESLRNKVGSLDLWIDLKCRQIRVSRSNTYNEVKGYREYTIDDKTYIIDPSNPRTSGDLYTPPWSYIEIDHKISVDLSKPITCWFGDGKEKARLVDIIDGNKLVMLDGPKRVVGSGEGINIVDPSLVIEGYFTPRDLEYIDAAKFLGIHTYMLSYVEKNSDIEELLELDPKAIVIAKIESKKGVKWVESSYEKYKDRVTLMAARGDLYTEVGRPDSILGALGSIILSDNRAILASRILTSLSDSTRPNCSDITDLGYAYLMGYRNFMMGDELCFDKDKIFLALDILSSIME